MKSKNSRSKFFKQSFHAVLAFFCGASLSTRPSLVFAQEPRSAQSQVMTTTSPTAQEAPKIPDDQLDSLVAPIALYPDPLLGQTLAASTYPLEVIQLQQWMDRNKNLKDKALADAVQKQNWDPSVQAMAAFPDVVQRLAGNIQWTTDLGNAFLAQQADVMAAVQRMRTKAQSKGALKTSAQQKVEAQTVEDGKQVIVIEQANPQVIYVPSYDPVVVYGAPVYPYPSYYYPGYVPGMALSFGAGLALGAAWGGGWGWGCGWGHGDVGNAPYGNRQTANKYAGAGNRSGAGGAGTMNRPSAGGAGTANRSGGGSGAGAGNIGSTRPAGGGGAGTRPGGGASTMPAARPSGGGGGGDRIGGRTPSAGGGGGAFGGGGMSGSSARSASSRGSYSMGGGGFSGGGRGGGGRGGGGRGGGGGRRR